MRPSRERAIKGTQNQFSMASEPYQERENTRRAVPASRRIPQGRAERKQDRKAAKYRGSTGSSRLRLRTISDRQAHKAAKEGPKVKMGTEVSRKKKLIWTSSQRFSFNTEKKRMAAPGADGLSFKGNSSFVLCINSIYRNLPRSASRK